MAALSASYQFLDETPLTVRVWVGAARVKATFQNGGTFHGVSRNAAGSTGDFALDFDLKEESPSLWIPFAGPEARFGYRFSKSFMVDAGVAALFMFAPETVRRAYDGDARAYSAAVTSGDTYEDGSPLQQPGEIELPRETGFATIVGIVPTVSARLDF
jgi:hypothetical protein